MFIKSFKTPGLAHFSYIIADGAEAAVIDPRRDVDEYIAIAKANDCNITHIFETHRNEDLISGAPILADLTGAKVYHGPNADGEVTYAETIVEGTKVELGAMSLEVLETPGHTKDSISILVFDQAFGNGPVGIFTGDTMFVGEVGRTDFYPKEKRRVAGMLFDSLKKIENRAPAAIIYPAHGAGSVCGDGMADREFSTVKHESCNSPMLQISDKEEFIDKKVAEHHYYVPYFERMEKLNMVGGNAYNSPRIISPIQYADIENESHLLIDVRSVESYLGAHFPRSISLPVGMIAAYAGWFISPQETLVIVADNEAMASEAALHFARIGYDHTQCYIPANFPAYAAQGGVVESSNVLNAQQVKHLIESENWQLVDVRKINERKAKHIEDSKHIFLGHLADEIDQFSTKQKIITMCASGIRATVAASILRRSGIETVSVFMGSFGAWKNAGFPVVE